MIDSSPNQSRARTQRRQSSMHGRLPEPPLDTMRSRSSDAFSLARKIIPMAFTT